MRKTAVLTTILLLSIFILPFSVCGISALCNNRKPEAAETFTETAPKGDGSITAGSFDKPFGISIYITETGEIENLDFEEYIAGVVAYEMPPTYNIEALSAQAVAARSYILSKAEAYFKGEIYDEHHGAIICDNPTHCKAWLPLSKTHDRWDYRHADDYEAKIRSAAARTEGEYLTYNGQVAKTYFYAISSGRTENSEDVWGVELPYLRSVDSREDILSDGYESLSTFTAKSLYLRLKQIRSDFSYTQHNDDDNMFSVLSRSEGGGIIKLRIGNTEFFGSELREILGLKSCCFDIEINGKPCDNKIGINDDDKITFRVYGYGHGVGMSQNGANVLAERGMKYQDILKHYYTDVDIVNLYKKV